MNNNATVCNECGKYYEDVPELFICGGCGEVIDDRENMQG